ncbi:RagB/SusD family nutrient uptake outer membrane protein [Persicitalea jodogahamensis]|uniref:Membrane protein n=1 Tax=Persicitalea jodogahamensis TaxID=402147 RepID=A0A8J3G8B4_9BACT|nr:RagB/SusD family nutrient uptake outer membrane protein [Persicitalea jodogahamensis]GHB63711.1 membrane protein [Persicitalea jodogahamensis]
MNIQILKKSVVLTAVLGTGIMFGCNEEILDQKNPNALTPSTFWQTQEDATKAILGAYSPFTHIWDYARFEIFLSDYRDDVVNGYGTSERTGIGNFNGISLGNGTMWVWSTNYQGITRANEVLFNVPDIKMDATLRDNILGEAYFIRAYNYFQLVNNWLNVPLITQPITEIKDPEAITQADPEEVWKLIISDLTQAQKLLPQKWNAANVGRATWGTATGYLGKVYLYRKNFQAAKAEFKKIIDSGNYKLTDDYSDNFTEDKENNSESLFEIQLIADGNGGWGGDAPGLGKGAAFQPDIAPAGFTGQDGMRINQWALDLFLDEKTINGEVDPRTYTTMFWNTTAKTNYRGKTLAATTYEGKTYTQVYGANAKNLVYGNKFLDTRKGYSSSQNISWHQSGNNLRLMRYADVLLMYAEAEMGSFGGGAATQAAVDAVNLVRKRADMPLFDLKMTMQDIADERVKELTLERSRYFDLLRWGMVKSRIADNPQFKSESGGTGAYKPGREYIDIPQNELDANPNFKHNPGY